VVDKAKKIQVVEQLKEDFSSASAIVVASFKGLTIAETDQLRQTAKKNGSKIKVTKNTLAQVALKGTAHAEVAKLFKNQTVVVYSNEPLGPSKTLVNFAKTSEKLTVLGGSFDGKFAELSGVQSYASVPSLDESRAQIVSLLKAPASELVRVLKSYSEKNA
jgi:large subunit ribosomal protein L10